jgi:hypothetical protein
MSGDEKQGSHQIPPADPAHAAWVKEEIDDVNVWAAVKFAIGLLIIGIIAYIGLYGLQKHFEHERQAAEGPPPLMARGAEDRLPPAPRLQMMPGSPSEFRTPDYEMKVMLEDEEKTLKSYGWVDKGGGVVRIPIDEAMRLVVEKGLPTKPAAGASPATTPSPTGTTSREK